ncbi:hypothetical protein WM45_13660 [Citrobacter sp. AATXR]|nr:hypothetical protein WM45_13660 [Citrobacter sp. AATXR]
MPSSSLFIEHTEKAANAAFSIFRLYLFSDLRSGEEELLQHGHKKRVIVAMSGLLHHEQI